jgi:hypothetical protein
MGWMIRPCGVGGDGVAAGVVCGYWGGWGVVCCLGGEFCCFGVEVSGELAAEEGRLATN